MVGCTVRTWPDASCSCRRSRAMTPPRAPERRRQLRRHRHRRVALALWPKTGPHGPPLRSGARRSTRMLSRYPRHSSAEHRCPVGRPVDRLPIDERTLAPDLAQTRRSTRLIFGSWGDVAPEHHITLGRRVGPVRESPLPAATLVDAAAVAPTIRSTDRRRSARTARSPNDVVDQLGDPVANRSRTR